MPNVFLSYDSDDRALASKIAVALQQLGHTVWWDRNIRGGAEFSAEIDRALQSAEAIVVLWSKQSIASPWVRDEAGTGREKECLIPARIDNCRPPLGFRQYQTIDLQAGVAFGAAVDELDRAIRAISSSPPSRKIHSDVERSASDGQTRRQIWVAGSTAALVAAVSGGFWLYRKAEKREAPPEVQPLLLQARQLLNQNTREGQNQAAGLFQRVTALAPNYADGWGWLGYSYAIMSHFRPRPEGLMLQAKARSAAHHALDLDPRSAFGELALGAALPFVGPYSERERRLRRAVALAPDEDETLTFLGNALQWVGRSLESIPFYERAKRKGPLNPAEYNDYIIALWNGGKLPELDQAISDAASLYPSQTSIWFTRLEIATYGGQVNAVQAMIDDEQTRPSDLPKKDADDFLAVTRAIATRDAKLIDSIMAQHMAAARESAGMADFVIRNAAAFGRLDDAFALANAFYFGRGFVIPDFEKGNSYSPEQRETRLLFEPVTKPMRSDARFGQLADGLGLSKYWKESGHPPDYKHVAGL